MRTFRGGDRCLRLGGGDTLDLVAQQLALTTVFTSRHALGAPSVQILRPEVRIEGAIGLAVHHHRDVVRRARLEAIVPKPDQTSPIPRSYDLLARRTSRGNLFLHACGPGRVYWVTERRPPSWILTV